MRTLERRIAKLESEVAGPDSEAMSFDVRFVDATTKSESERLVLGGNGSRTWYESDGHGGWRQVDEPA